jgi:hypothetical protein
MTKRLSICYMCLSLVLGACAGAGVRPDGLQVTISPEKIYPGCVVSISVQAPPGTTNVTARLDFPGSPLIPLKSYAGGQTWIFSTQIPLDAVWQPGKYRAIVEGRTAGGEAVRGEAWIIAL